VISARVRGLALLVLAFAVGGVAGFSLGRSPRMAATPTNPMEPHLFVQRLGAELGLDTAQRDSIVAILTRRQSTVDSAWRQLRPSVRATIDSAQREIVNVLRPDQRPKYLELSRASHGAMGQR
jgi:hypothetical protein